MNRRRFLGVAAIMTTPFLAGCLGGAASGDNDGKEGYVPLTDHYFSEAITYNHKQLRLHPRGSAVSSGETIDFRITNTGDSSIVLGCRNPWTIQKSVDGQWRDVVWTSAENYLTCETRLPAGESIVENVTVSKAALETQTEEVRLKLSSGQYRFVLLSTDPYLAADFHIRA